MERTIASDKTWSLGAGLRRVGREAPTAQGNVGKGEAELIAKTVNGSIAIQ